MSVLLQQAYGFEGLGVRDELLHANDAICAKLVHTTARRTLHSASGYYLSAALSPHAAISTTHNDAISHGAYVLDLESRLGVPAVERRNADPEAVRGMVRRAVPLCMG